MKHNQEENLTYMHKSTTLLFTTKMTRIPHIRATEAVDLFPITFSYDVSDLFKHKDPFYQRIIQVHYRQSLSRLDGIEVIL